MPCRTNGAALPLDCASRKPGQLPPGVTSFSHLSPSDRAMIGRERLEYTRLLLRSGLRWTQVLKSLTASFRIGRRAADRYLSRAREDVFVADIGETVRDFQINRLILLDSIAYDSSQPGMVRVAACREMRYMAGLGRHTPMFFRDKAPACDRGDGRVPTEEFMRELEKRMTPEAFDEMCEVMVQLMDETELDQGSAGRFSYGSSSSQTCNSPCRSAPSSM